jgi:predicted phosphodiesterase
LRIGLASDSFGNLDALERALEVFARAPVERVFFLGGRYADVDAALARRRGASRKAPVPGDDLEFLAAVESALEREAERKADPLEGRVVRVASRACPEIHRGAPWKLMEMVAGQISCLVHDKANLSREDIGNATLLFHGNSSEAALVPIGPRFFVTPGHLREPAPAGHPATFAVLEVGAQELELVVHAAGGEEVRRLRAPFGSRSKMTVR